MVRITMSSVTLGKSGVEPQTVGKGTARLCHIMLPHVQTSSLSLATVPVRTDSTFIADNKNGCEVNVTDTIYSLHSVCAADTNLLTAAVVSTVQI